MARTWSDSRGGQCLALPIVGGLCPQHGRCGIPHGRVDGPVPASKLLEFQAKANSIIAKSVEGHEECQALREYCEGGKRHGREEADLRKEGRGVIDKKFN